MGTTAHSAIRYALNQARKERDKVRTVVLSTLLSDVRNREIELGRAADDDTVRDVIARGIKQRRDSAKQMRVGRREDLAEKEEHESSILTEFLPPALDEGEVQVTIREILAEGPAEMGAVMGRLMPRIRGRYDGREAARLVREELAR